jgi:osmoprotectant transport system substrate-binding protein
MQRRRVRPLLLLALAVVLVVAGCGGDEPEKRRERGSPAAALPGTGKPAVRLGTKNFTEQYVVGQLYAQALRAEGFTVDLKLDIGSTEVADRALTSGVIDLYPEYTGTALSVVKGQSRIPDGAEATYQQAKRFYEQRGQTLLDRTPFEDRDAIVVTREYAEAHDLETTADLKRLDSITLGGPPEFRTRFAGLIGLRRAYGIRNVRFKALFIDDVVKALDEGRIQAGDVFTTDPRLAGSGYVILADPKGVFGYQNVAPVVDFETLQEQGSAFAVTLNAVSAQLTTDVMRTLNAAVDIDGEDPEAVARRFLQERGLL